MKGLLLFIAAVGLLHGAFSAEERPTIRSFNLPLKLALKKLLEWEKQHNSSILQVVPASPGGACDEPVKPPQNSASPVGSTNEGNEKAKIPVFKRADYEFSSEDKPLGSGAFGRVMRARCLTDDKEYAIKAISAGKIKKKPRRRMFKREVDLLCNLDHPFVLKAYGLFSAKPWVCIVTELVEGGDLFSLWDKHKVSFSCIWRASNSGNIVMRLAIRHRPGKILCS